MMLDGVVGIVPAIKRPSPNNSEAMIGRNRIASGMTITITNSAMRRTTALQPARHRCWIKHEEQAANRKGQAVHESRQVGRHAKARADHAAQRPADQQGNQPADAKRKTQSPPRKQANGRPGRRRFDVRCVVFGHRYSGQCDGLEWIFSGSDLAAGRAANRKLGFLLGGLRFSLLGVFFFRLAFRFGLLLQLLVRPPLSVSESRLALVLREPSSIEAF